MSNEQPKIEIKIDEEKLFASVLVSPGEEAGKCTKEKILEELALAGVIHGIKDDKINSIVEESDGLHEAKLYEEAAIHTPAQEPLPESITPKIKQSPAKLKALLDKTLKNTDKSIVITRTERIMVADGDKSDLVEKSIVRKVKKRVNPRLVASGFAQKGEVIAVYCEAVYGAPGKTVIGTPLSFEAEDAAPKSALYEGANIKRKDENYVAEFSGFFRIGNNWIDLIPYEIATLRILPSQKGTNCYLNYKPMEGKNFIPTESELIEKVENAGLDPVHLIPFEKIVEKIKKSQKSGEELTKFSVFKAQNCEIGIEVNPAETEAVLLLSKQIGEGIAISLSEISKAIKKKGIRGVSGEKLKLNISHFIKSTEMTARIQLSIGKPPTRGEDGHLDFAVERYEEAAVTELREYMLGNEKTTHGLKSREKFPIEEIIGFALVKEKQKIFTVVNGKTGKDGISVCGKKIPSIKGNDPFLEFFEDIEYTNGVGTAKIDGILDIGEDENTFRVRVRHHKDASIELSKTEDLMKAFLTSRLPEGSGLPLSADRIRKAMEEDGIEKGVFEDALEDAEARAAEGEILVDFLVAEGHLPTKDKQKMKLLVTLDPTKDNSANVKEGDVIAFFESSEKAVVHGFNIEGEQLTLREGGGVDVRDNIREQAGEGDDTGKTSLVAEKSGKLFFIDDQLYIKDTIVVEGDVSLITGNVKFPGSILIKGSVQPKCVVAGGGRVEVTGVVQEALVSSDKDIVIGKGIKGGKRAVIRAQGKSKLGYAEEANLMVVGEISFEKAMMHCQVKCNDKIIGTGAQAKILGGVIKARCGMEVHSIGSERSADTLIAFGQDYLVENQIEVINREIEKLNEYIEKIDKITERLLAGTESNEKKVSEARAQKIKSLKRVDKRKLKLFLLKEKFEMHHPSEVVVKGEVYPGVTFFCHDRTLTIPEIKRNITVYFDSSSGKIKYK